jgi:hypothetical protein
LGTSSLTNFNFRTLRDKNNKVTVNSNEIKTYNILPIDFFVDHVSVKLFIESSLLPLGPVAVETRLALLGTSQCVSTHQSNNLQLRKLKNCKKEM